MLIIIFLLSLSFWEIKCQKVKSTILKEINFRLSIKNDNKSDINYQLRIPDSSTHLVSRLKKSLK